MRTPVDFVDRSNAFFRGELKVCAKHLLSKWGKKHDGTWFEKCTQGFRSEEVCEELEDEFVMKTREEAEDDRRESEEYYGK